MTDRDAPLVFLPGTLCDGRVFAPVSARLGISPVILPLAGAENAPAMARHILRSTPPHFTLCGFSLGAIVALEVIAQAPGRVTRLALIGGSARVLPDTAAAERRQAARRARHEGTKSYVDDAWDVSVPKSRSADHDLRALLDEMAEATPVDVFHEQIGISLNRNDSRWRLSDIACPTLILCGAEDRVCPPDLSREMAAGIAGARLAVIEDAGHYVTLDQPDIVAREMREWLATPATTLSSKEMT